LVRRRHGIAARGRVALLALAAGLMGGDRGRADRDPGPPSRALQLLRQGLLAPAYTVAMQSLRRDPRSPDALAVAGAVEARRGWGVEAAALLDAGAHGPWYAAAGAAFHAEALSQAGRFGEAAALRRAVLASHGGERAWPDQAADLVDDLRLQGDLLAADDALSEGLAAWPRAEVLFAAAADLALDQGDFEEARGWLWLAERDRDAVFRIRLTRARLARAEGHVDEADALLAQLAQRRPRDPTVRALQAHRLCDDGEPEAAIALLERRRLDGLGHPVLLVALARARWLAGEVRQARADAAWLRARTPDHPDVRALVALVGG